MSDELDTKAQSGAEAPEGGAGSLSAGESPPSTELATSPEPQVSVKTNVSMRYRSVDADGKVTTVDVDPKAAKGLLWGGFALLIVSVLVIFAATLLLAAHFWPK